MQRSEPLRALLVPRETRAACQLRKRRLAALDRLLWRIEEWNWAWGPETFASWQLVAAARDCGCVLHGITGAALHAAVLDRQEALMRPVYIRRIVGLRCEEGGIPRIYPPAGTRLREIA